MIQRTEVSEKLPWIMSRSGVWFIGACLLWGTFVRVRGLEAKSYWDDEACTVRRIDQVAARGVIENVKESPFPPLFYLLERGIHQNRSVTKSSVRLLPLIAGLLAIPLTYCGVRSLGGSEMARWAVLLTATSSFHIHYSQDAKMYSLVWLFILCGNLGFLNLVLSPKMHWGWILIYLLGMTLLPWTSYVGVVGHGVQAIWFVVLAVTRWTCIRRHCAALALLFGLSLLPFVIWWAPIAIEASTRQHGIGWIPPIRGWQTSMLGFLETTASFLTGMHLAGKHTSAIVCRSIWGILTLGVVGCASLFRVHSSVDHQDESPNRHLLKSLFILWWSMPLLGCLIFSLLVYPLFGIPRFLCGAAPGLLLLIASATSSRNSRWGRCLCISVITLNIASVAWWHGHDVRLSTTQVVDQIQQKGLLSPQPELDGSFVLMVTKSPSSQFRNITLEVELNERFPRARIVWVDWANYRQIHGSTPILVFHESDGSRNSMSDTKHLLSLPEWSCLFRQEVFEHPLTAMVDPSQPRLIEVWSWTPTRRSEDRLP